MKIKIPLIPCDLNLYVGEQQFSFFMRKIKKLNPKLDLELGSGWCVQNNIWVFDTSLGTVFHELQHFYDWLFMEYLSCENEFELKAYIVEYVNCAVLKRIGKIGGTDHV